MRTTTTGRDPIDSFTRLFDPETHTYSADGQILPSVTQVLTEQRFIDFSNVPADVMAEARARGTYVHQVLHAYLENDFDLDDCDPRFRGYLDSAIAFHAEARLTAVRVEFRFWHVRRGFAGTVDYVAVDPDGVIVICDWKTGHPIDVAAALQTAAYEFGVRDYLLPTLGSTYGGPIRRQAIKLYRDGTPGTPEPYTDPRDLHVFLAALSCVHFKRNGMAHGGAGGYGHV